MITSLCTLKAMLAVTIFITVTFTNAQFLFGTTTKPHSLNWSKIKELWIRLGGFVVILWIIAIVTIS